MNIKKTVLVCMLSVLSCMLRAQTDTTRKNEGYIAVGMGADFPAGQFASVHSGGLGSYATASRCTFLAGGLIIKKLKFGFALKEEWFYSNYNAGKYVKTLQAKNTTPGATYSLVQYNDGKQYYGGCGMLGLIARLKVHNVFFMFRLMGGRLNAVFPEVTYVVNTAGTQVLYDYASSSASAFVAEGGVMVGWNAFKHWCFFADAGVTYSNLVYVTTLENNTYPNNTQTTQQAACRCPITVIPTYLGVAYTF